MRKVDALNCIASLEKDCRMDQFDGFKDAARTVQSLPTAVMPTNDWEDRTVWAIARFCPLRRERGSVSQPLAPFLPASDSGHIATVCRIAET